MKKSIFLSYPISNNELIRVKELLNNPKEEVEVYASKYDKYLIHATDINIIGIEEFDDREYDRPAFKIQLNNFIDDWLSYDAVGLFYSKKQNYYEGIRYSTVKELGTVLRMADALNCIIDSENITELYILQRSSELFSPSGSLTEGSLLENILKEICREKKIKYKYIYNRNLLVLRYRQMITIIAKNILKDTLSFFAWIINIYHLKKCYRNSKSKQIVFVGGARGFKKIIKTFDDRKIPTIHYRNK